VARTKLSAQLAFVAVLILASNLGALTASASDGLRIVPGQTVTIPLRGGVTLTVVTTAGDRVPRGQAIKMGDPSSYIETTAVFATGFGTAAATYKLHTDWYWDGGSIIQVTPYTIPYVYVAGFGFAYQSTGWYWTTYPTSAKSYSYSELDSYVWTPYGSALIWQCRFHIEHYVNGWGGAYGFVYRDAC
jgi:hypothetical protein